MFVAIAGNDYKLDCLPATVDCVLCKAPSAMSVYNNLDYNNWAYCHVCKAAGTPLIILQQKWKLSTKDTLQHAIEEGITLSGSVLSANSVLQNLPNKVIDTLQQHYDQQLYLTSVFDTCRNTLFNSTTELQELQACYGITASIDVRRWRKMIGNNIVPVTADVVKNNRSLFRRRETKLNTNYDSVAIPVYLQPGRMNGFLAAQYPESSVWKWFGLSPTITTGFGFYDSVLEFNTLLSNTVFVVYDPELAIKLHSLWFRDHSTVLPLILAPGCENVLSTAITPMEMFDCLPKRDYVFIYDKPIKDIFVQAARCDGRVVITPTDNISFSKYFVWLHQQKNLAVSWDAALEAQLPRIPEPELIGVVNGLAYSEEEWRRFFECHSNIQLKTRLKAVINRDWVTKKALFTKPGRLNKPLAIVTRAHAWYNDGHQIANFNITVLKYYIRDSEVWIKASMVMLGTEPVVFDIKENIFIKTKGSMVMPTLTKLAIQSKWNKVPTCDPFWVPYIYDIAKSLSKNITVDHANHDVVLVDKSMKETDDARRNNLANKVNTIIDSRLPYVPADEAIADTVHTKPVRYPKNYPDPDRLRLLTVD